MSDVDAAIANLIDAATTYGECMHMTQAKTLNTAEAHLRALLTPTITEADVEAGAIALFEGFAYIEGETGPAWKAIPELGRDRWKREARLVLEAAARQRATGSGVTA